MNNSGKNSITKSLLLEGNAKGNSKGNTRGNTTQKPSNPRPNTQPVPTQTNPKKK